MREELFIPEHRTNILPLRWLANYIFHPISMYFFKIGLRANDKIEWDYQYTNWNRFLESFGWKWYTIFDKPYAKWGTVYEFKGNLDDLGGSGWNDYDDRGIPYWDYWWHTDDPADDWRILPKSKFENVRDGEIHPSIEKDIKNDTQ